jgi:segregation and condensation protein B
MNNELNKKIESYLFCKNEQIYLKDLSKIFDVDIDIIKNEIENLKKRYQDSGLSLKITDDKVAISTSNESSEFIEKLSKEELNKDLSKATIETLAIIIYRGPIKRPEIDYIRGVSSQFILRNLQIRGLIEKVLDPKDSRSYFYKPSIDLLNFLGISEIKEMPEFEQVNEDIKKYLESEENLNQDNLDKEKNIPNPEI